MKKLVWVLLLLAGCASTRYVVVCKDAPESGDIYGGNIKGCSRPVEGTVIVRHTPWGERTYVFDRRSDCYRVVRFKRIKAQR